MAGKIEKLKGIASAMESGAAKIESNASEMESSADKIRDEIRSDASDMKDVAKKINGGADVLKKGIRILEYWGSGNENIREEDRQKVLKYEKKDFKYI